MKSLRLELRLGEQLAGLSPLVCRRAIAALRKADADAGGDNREESNLPPHCAGLFELVTGQTNIWNNVSGDLVTHVSSRNNLLTFLSEAERFLDIVEGIERPETPAEPAPAAAPTE